jgi:hypothetical protein
MSSPLSAWYHPTMSAAIERWEPPNDPTAFESLCLDLWREVWHDLSAQKNGRSGQPQPDVDVFGQHEGKWVGVQCKQKHGLVRRKVTVQELEAEVEVVEASHWEVAGRADGGAAGGR